MAGFWEGLEAWILDLQRDRARLARYMAFAWWTSTFVVLLGAALIILTAAGVI